MAVIVYFPPSDMTVAQYDGIVADLKAAGAYPAPGLLSHSCFPTEGGKLSVCDLWESEASFHKFGETMMPLLVKSGATPSEPFISEVHNFLVPEPART
jgi:hypothetical protein